MAAVALGCGLLLSAETAAGLELFERYGAVVEKPEVWLSAPELYGDVRLPARLDRAL